MKLRAHEYCAYIGFTDSKAVVSKRAARQYRRYDFTRFLSEGLYKQAFSLAYYSGSQTQMQQVLNELQTKLAHQGDPLPGQSLPQSSDDLIQIFGIIPVPRQLNGMLYV